MMQPIEVTASDPVGENSRSHDPQAFPRRVPGEKPSVPLKTAEALTGHSPTSLQQWTVDNVGMPHYLSSMIY